MLISSEHFNDVCAKTSQLCKLPTWLWLTRPIITLHKAPSGLKQSTNAQITLHFKKISWKYEPTVMTIFLHTWNYPVVFLDQLTKQVILEMAKAENISVIIWLEWIYNLKKITYWVKLRCKELTIFMFFFKIIVCLFPKADVNSWWFTLISNSDEFLFLGTLWPINGLVDFWSKSVVRSLDLYFQTRSIGFLGPIDAFICSMSRIHILNLMSRIHFSKLMLRIFFYLSKSKASSRSYSS